MLTQLHHQTGKKWPLPFSGLISTKPVAMMASLLDFLKQAEMSLLTASTTLSATCGHWKTLPSDWSLNLLCPVLKKGDATICTNYRGISLLMIAYRILSSVLCERLKPFVNKLNGSYQCGKSTIDQIFTLWQIFEKTQEKQIATHHHPYRDLNWCGFVKWHLKIPKVS